MTFFRDCVRAFLILLTLVALTTANHALAADETNTPAGLAVYSGMNFIESEREFVGLQVALIPYYDGDKTRQKILWRSAGPFLEVPLLLDVTQDGKIIRVVVPDGHDDAGTWTLTVKGNVLDAVGPNAHKYSLKKISLK